VVRRGRRAGRASLVLYVLDAQRQAEWSREARSAPKSDIAPTREGAVPSRVGFIVSKAVGSAVVRHRVTRRLRHLMRDRIAAVPAGTLVVVRALPPAAIASSCDLGGDLDALFRKLRMPTFRDEQQRTDCTR
jgi:ribonuclease P protein component